MKINSPPPFSTSRHLKPGKKPTKPSQPPFFGMKIDKVDSYDKPSFDNFLAKLRSLFSLSLQSSAVDTTAPVSPSLNTFESFSSDNKSSSPVAIISKSTNSTSTKNSYSSKNSSSQRSFWSNPFGKSPSLKSNLTLSSTFPTNLNISSSNVVDILKQNRGELSFSVLSQISDHSLDDIIKMKDEDGSTVIHEICKPYHTLDSFKNVMERLLRLSYSEPKPFNSLVNELDTGGKTPMARLIEREIDNDRKDLQQSKVNYQKILTFFASAKPDLSQSIQEINQALENNKNNKSFQELHSFLEDLQSKRDIEFSAHPNLYYEFSKKHVLPVVSLANEANR